MKILVVSNCAPYHFLGSGLVISKFTEGLITTGNEVDFYTTEKYKDYSETSSYFGYRYHQLFKILFYILKKMSKIKNYDIIEFYGGVSSLAVYFLKKITKFKGKIVIHTNAIEIRHDEYKNKYSIKKRWYQFDEKFLVHHAYFLADAVITVSEDESKWLTDNGYPKSGKVKSISPGLADEFLGLDIDFYKKEKVIVFCGNWLHRKGINILIQIIPGIMRRRTDWNLLIIGALDSFDVKAYFPLDILDRIKVIPFLKNRDDLIKLYKSASICIVPSYYESFGLVMGESMACGCALITSRVGFALELADNQNAVIIDIDNVSSFADRLENLIEDTAFRLYISKNGYEKAQSLSWPTAISDLNYFYRDMVGI